MNYLFMDTETGGIGLDKSLLTAFFHVTDEKMNHVDELSLKLKPNDGIYHVEGAALKVNKINILKHDSDKNTFTYKGACMHLYGFLRGNFNGKKMIPVGHNVKFDISHITNKLISSESWDKFVSYRCLDIQSIAQFLMLTGKLNNEISGSLESIFNELRLFEKNPGAKGWFHTAEGDATACYLILKEFIELYGKLPS